MCNDKGTYALEKPVKPNAVRQHPENTGALAVGDRVEALKDARDVTVVLLHHWMTIFLRVRLQEIGAGMMCVRVVISSILYTSLHFRYMWADQPGSHTEGRSAQNLDFLHLSLR